MKKVFYLIVGFLMVLPTSVFASGEGGGGGGEGDASGGDVVFENPLGVDSIGGIVDKIVNFLLVLAGPIAFLMIVYAGFLFVIGGTSENNVKKAKKIILSVVIGIAVLVLSKAIVYVVCSSLGASCTPTSTTTP